MVFEVEEEPYNETRDIIVYDGSFLQQSWKMENLKENEE